MSGASSLPFYNRYYNFVDWRQVGFRLSDGVMLRQYRNVAKSETWGAEIAASYWLTQQWELATAGLGRRQDQPGRIAAQPHAARGQHPPQLSGQRLESGAAGRLRRRHEPGAQLWQQPDPAAGRVSENRRLAQFRPDRRLADHRRPQGQPQARQPARHPLHPLSGRRRAGSRHGCGPYTQTGRP